jgi:general secretion pathway protein C
MWALGFHHNQSMVTLSQGSRATSDTSVISGMSGKWPKVAMVAVTFGVWALAAACLLYWVLRLTASPTPASAPPQVSIPTAADPQLVGRLLGARAASPAIQASLASRFNLQGVISGGSSGGAALIAVDGKPARPFAVGSVVDEGLVLKSTSGRSVALAETRIGPTVLTLDMPLFK